MYFNRRQPGAAAAPPPPPPEKVAVLREAEETVNTYQCSGVAFVPAFDPSASGPASPNMLSYSWGTDDFTIPVGLAVTIPRPGKYSIALRARGNSGDHPFRALWDNREIFKGTFGLEGEDWNMVLLPVMELGEGVHYLELQTKLGAGKRPLDLDLVVITDAKNYQPRQCLRAFPGKAEARP